ACFHPSYFAETPTASMRKLPVVAREVERLGLARLHDPGSVDPSVLMRLHDPDYVRSFLSGKGSLASSQGWTWTPQIRDGVLAIQAGQLRGAQMALEQGLAANIAQGFHHSCYGQGGGYCTFNGLALVAQENPGLRVGVLDCDAHEGNGTAEFTRRLNNLYNITLYGSSSGAKPGPRSLHYPLPQAGRRFEIFLTRLTEGLAQMRDWKIDLLIYQAGADPHEDDPLGDMGMSTHQLMERDRCVFVFCRTHGIPVLFVLAGGYQEPIETALLPLHVNTFRAASEAFGFQSGDFNL
ncbi:MAG: histone deacetylase, partial [Verrucomicrobiae bacterium]|nr:histone deacetylase [Verrucomicrobiae bacterium]